MSTAPISNAAICLSSKWGAALPDWTREHDSQLAAGHLVQTIEARQGHGLIGNEALARHAERHSKTEYGDYPRRRLDRRRREANLNRRVYRT